MYGGEEFASDVREYRGMVDAAMKDADATTLKSIEEHFIMCCKLEYMFWSQASDCMEWPDITATNGSK